MSIIVFCIMAMLQLGTSSFRADAQEKRIVVVVDDKDPQTISSRNPIMQEAVRNFANLLRRAGWAAGDAENMMKLDTAERASQPQPGLHEALVAKGGGEIQLLILTAVSELRLEKGGAIEHGVRLWSRLMSYKGSNSNILRVLEMRSRSTSVENTCVKSDECMRPLVSHALEGLAPRTLQALFLTPQPSALQAKNRFYLVIADNSKKATLPSHVVTWYLREEVSKRLKQAFPGELRLEDIVNARLVESSAQPQANLHKGLVDASDDETALHLIILSAAAMTTPLADKPEDHELTLNIKVRRVVYFRKEALPDVGTHELTNRSRRPIDGRCLRDEGCIGGRMIGLAEELLPSLTNSLLRNVRSP